MYRKCTNETGKVLTMHRIPFFFEPNFDALVEPLAAAGRIKDQIALKGDSTRRKPVVYGQFLTNKVGNNFADGQGRYGADE